MPFGAEGRDVIFPFVVLLLFVMREVFDANAVVKWPPKMIDEPLALGWIDRTGPLKPPNGMSDQADEVELHNARLPSDPSVAPNDPPTQTSPR